ncbi:hypothetical protein [Micromonospora chokoriensis]|uniref:Uncharacterized protein n=1 Tax=Micromonospora chokoriensis TaxID=356851 RepID=A0A1C4V6K3_9ACTN|nr:hypothetical protein [Micromonospora chokoriensis]SCE79643.1 hypothetical protein GA0070612_1137 [Micromonospora chokoriensis]
MDLPARRNDTVRAFGTVSLVAGFLTTLLTMSSGYEGLEPHILAAFLILTGLGLRIEAAIADRRM